MVLSETAESWEERLVQGSRGGPCMSGPWLLTTTETSLTVLKAKSPKSRHGQAMLPLKAPGQSLFQDLLLALGIASCPRNSLACRCFTPTSASVVVWLFSRVCVSPPFFLWLFFLTHSTVQCMWEAVLGSRRNIGTEAVSGLQFCHLQVLSFWKFR